MTGGEGRVFADSDDQIRRIYENDVSILEKTHAALSGEEYRQRLATATGFETNTKEITGLPYGSGSGLVNPRTDTSGYVFCIRIGDQVRFRMVPTDNNWQPLLTDEDEPIVSHDTLTALIAADPETEDTPRDFLADAYEGAFNAWEIAKQDVFEEWKQLADGSYLQPEVPKALRTASELLYKNPDALDSNDQEDLLLRLNTAPSNRIVRDVRTILTSEDSDKRKLAAIHRLLVESGVQPATAPPDIKQIEPDEIRLVCWMAVRSSADS